MSVAEEIRSCLIAVMDSYGIVQTTAGVPELTEDMVAQMEKLFQLRAPVRTPSKEEDEDGESSGSRRGKTAYSSFISKITQPEVKSIQVNINPRFKETSKNKLVYVKNADKFVQSGPITIEHLQNIVSTVLKGAGGKITQMKQSAFVWNLLSDDDRSKVLGCC